MERIKAYSTFLEMVHTRPFENKVLLTKKKKKPIWRNFGAFSQSLVLVLINITKGQGLRSQMVRNVAIEEGGFI